MFTVCLQYLLKCLLLINQFAYLRTSSVLSLSLTQLFLGVPGSSHFNNRPLRPLSSGSPCSMLKTLLWKGHYCWWCQYLNWQHWGPHQRHCLTGSQSCSTLSGQGRAPFLDQHHTVSHTAGRWLLRCTWGRSSPVCFLPRLPESLCEWHQFLPAVPLQA